MKALSIILFVLALNAISCNFQSKVDFNRRLRVKLNTNCYRSWSSNNNCAYYDQCVQRSYKCPARGAQSFTQGKNLCNSLNGLSKKAPFKNGAGKSWIANMHRCMKSFTHAEVLRKSRGQGTRWVRIGGGLINVTSGNDGRVWGVNRGNYIYTRMGVRGRWVRIAGRLKQISVDTNGRVWGVNRHNQIYTGTLRKGNRSVAWRRIGGSLKQVSVGYGARKGKVQRIWGVNRHNHIWTKLGPNGRWQRIAGTLKWIATARDGRVWGVNRYNHIYTRPGVKGSWKRIPGSLKQISVANDGTVWGVNKYNQIWTRRGVNAKWRLLTGRLMQVDIGKDGRSWGVAPGDSIWTTSDQADDCKRLRTWAQGWHNACAGTTGLCTVIRQDKKARSEIARFRDSLKSGNHGKLVGNLTTLLNAKACK